ncbi:hypothetical protein BN1051_01934 [Arthrobacter saudimassiliensis]|uniref:FMN-binding domain-containing protein n=1 Tax=Arthrobacter saudimassiliensis TaxID=1461584 RepID=A0A078MQK3_9MICC|nr:hypothetical protein BN1051_01934 [Arthrobacter saudimassiliensis]
MKPPARKHLLAVAAGLSLIGAAGCAADEAAPEAPAAGPSSAGKTAAPSGTYADGGYAAEGSYIPPSGTAEQVDVELTLEDGTVTALEVATSGTNPTSARYQQEFTDNIQDQVVGRNIDELDVGKVAGSSLTSRGFNEALERIKTEARS